MEAILTDVGTVFNSAVGWVGEVATTIAGEPVLMLFCVAVPLVGLGVGLFKRLLSARG